MLRRLIFISLYWVCRSILKNEMEEIQLNHFMGWNLCVIICLILFHYTENWSYSISELRFIMFYKCEMNDTNVMDYDVHRSRVCQFYMSSAFEMSNMKWHVLGFEASVFHGWAKSNHCAPAVRHHFGAPCAVSCATAAVWFRWPPADDRQQTAAASTVASRQASSGKAADEARRQGYVSVADGEWRR